MPGVLPTLGQNGSMPAMWSALIQQINGVASVAAGAASNPARQSLDQYGNTTFITGPLEQVVTIGAAYQQYGVHVGTNLGAVFGAASPSGFAQTMISTTEGSTVATVASGAGFVNGHVIGAIDVIGPFEEPDTTTEVDNVLTPGTTYTITGTAVTLSLPALLGGSDFYCCSCLWTPLGGVVHP